jgi:hypothetical protein
LKSNYFGKNFCREQPVRSQGCIQIVDGGLHRFYVNRRRRKSRIVGHPRNNAAGRDNQPFGGLGSKSIFSSEFKVPSSKSIGKMILPDCSASKKMKSLHKPWSR